MYFIAEKNLLGLIIYWDEYSVKKTVFQNGNSRASFSFLGEHCVSGNRI
jgi:hypothetical protein